MCRYSPSYLYVELCRNDQPRFPPQHLFWSNLPIIYNGAEIRMVQASRESWKAWNACGWESAVQSWPQRGKLGPLSSPMVSLWWTFAMLIDSQKNYSCLTYQEAYCLLGGWGRTGEWKEERQALWTRKKEKVAVFKKGNIKVFQMLGPKAIFFYARLFTIRCCI